MEIQTKIQLCVFPKFDENHHVRSGVVFTPEVRMKHVDRRWKSYQQGTRGNPQSLNAMLQSTSGYLYVQTSCCVEEEFHTKMRDLKRENSLNLVLLIIITFITFIH